MLQLPPLKWCDVRRGPGRRSYEASVRTSYRGRLEVDPRIRFALNCGAGNCPAVLAYDPDTVDETLDDATRSSLGETVEYNAERNQVRVPRFCP